MYYAAHYATWQVRTNWREPTTLTDNHDTTPRSPTPCCCARRYHSHPIFEPRPSRKDMDNQRNYQALTRDSSSGSNADGSCCGSNGLSVGSSGSNGGRAALEPFVGFILSPFDPALPMPHTSAKAFVVQQRGPANSLVPYNIRWVGFGVDCTRRDCRDQCFPLLRFMTELPHTSAKTPVVQQPGPANALVPYNIRWGLWCVLGSVTQEMARGWRPPGSRFQRRHQGRPPSYLANHS